MMWAISHRLKSDTALAAAIALGVVSFILPALCIPTQVSCFSYRRLACGRLVLCFSLAQSARRRTVDALRPTPVFRVEQVETLKAVMRAFKHR